MKIIGISGSPREANSQTFKLVEAALEGAKSVGSEIELVDVCKLKIEYCSACQTCFQTGVCIHQDDFQSLYEKMLSYEGMVWGSPNYFRSITAQLKTLVDRMADAIHCQLLTGKYCAIVASGGGNYQQVTEYLTDLMVNFGAFVSGSAGAVMSEGTQASDYAIKKAFELGKTLAEDIRVKRDYHDQRKAQENNRKYFMNLVKMNKDEWEHEYQHWDTLNWK